MREAYLDKLLRVDGSVIVAALSNVSRKLNSGGVGSLPDIGAVDTTSNFADQDRCQALRSELLVHTKEVDFSHTHGTVIDMSSNGDTSDETHQKFVRS